MIILKNEVKEKHLEKIKRERIENIKNDNISFEALNASNNMKWHSFLYNAISIMNRINRCKLEIDGNYPISDRKFIIAPNHVRKQDIEIIMEAFKDHMFLLSGDHENVHGTISGTMLEKNGIIYFDMEDKVDRKNVVKVIEDVLKKTNVLWFYEGSWNLSSNKPYYNGSYQIVQTAIDSNAIVIPVSFDLINQKGLYNKVACVYFGDPIDYRALYGNRKLTNEEKIEALDILKGQIGKGLFKIWEKYSIENRENIDLNYWDRYKKKVLSEWKFNEEDIERKHFVDKDKVDTKDVFDHLDKLKLNSNNAFLLSKKNHH